MYETTLKDLVLFKGSLTLKDLTLNLSMLLCLTTGQRGQTLLYMDTRSMQELDDGFRIIINEKLKQTKPGKHLAPIKVIAYPDDKSICVVDYLKEYLTRTKPLRKEVTQLLISYAKPFKPVAMDTIARWVRNVLEQSGIDVEKYSLHSSRAASTSHCKAKGLTLPEIMKSAGWSNARAFARYYDMPLDTDDLNFGTVLLNSTTSN